MSYEVSQLPVRSRIRDTAVSSVSVGLSARHEAASGTPAIGMGVSAILELPDAAGNYTVAGKIQSVWTDATNGSEDAATSIWSVTAGAIQEYARFSANQIRLYGANLHWGVGDSDTVYWDAQFQATQSGAAFSLGLYNTADDGLASMQVSGDTAWLALENYGSASAGNFFAAHAPLADLSTVYSNFGSLVVSSASASASLFLGYGNKALGLLIDGNGNIVPKTAALTAAATQGFFHMLGFENRPTGVPGTTFSGRQPFGWDVTNDELWVYRGGWNLANALKVRKNSGAVVGTRRQINLIEGSNITLTVVDDAGTDKEVDITIAAAASGVTDHGALTGLADDDHTQYLLLAGRAGGQTAIGGTAASENLTLQSTAHATRGNIVLSDVTTIPVGAAATPSLVFAGDTNTGIWQIAADNISMSTGGAERFRLASTQLYSIVPVRTDAGTAASPSFGFNADTNTGVFSPGADQWAVSTGGTERFTVSTTIVRSSLQIQGPTGSAGTPSFSFSGDVDTGIFNSSADVIAFATAGVQRASISNSSWVATQATSGGNVKYLTFTSAGHGAVTASAEHITADFAFNATVTHSTGAISMNRTVLFRAPTHAFAGASTITDAATVAIDAAPIAGTNATITRAWALLAQSGSIGAGSGSVSLPGYAFASDPDTGWYVEGANTLKLALGGLNKVVFDSSGDVRFTDNIETFDLDFAASQVRLESSTQTLFESGLAAGSGAVDYLVRPLNTRTAGSLFQIDNNTAGAWNFSVEFHGGASIQQTTRTGIVLPATESTRSFTVTAGALADLTSTGSGQDVYFNVNRTINYATSGTTPQWSGFAISSGAAFTGDVATRTITDASTMYIEGPPTAGSNAAITRAYSLWIDSGYLRYDQTIAAGSDVLTFTNGPAGTAGNPDVYLHVYSGTTTYAIPAFAV